MKKISALLSFAVLCTLSAKEITDHLDNKIELKEAPKKIIIQGILPLTSVFTVFNGGNSELIGIPLSAKKAAQYSLLDKFFPNTKNISTEFDGGIDANAEAIMAANPDAVFYRTDYKPVADKLLAAKIPAIGFSTSKFGQDAIKTFDAWLSLLGDIMGKEDKAKGIVEHAYEVQQHVKNRVENGIAKEGGKKLRAIALFRFKNGVINVSGKKSFSSFWFANTGLENAYTGEKGSEQISLEELYALDPDIIFITNFTSLQPKDMEKPIENIDFSKLKAVQDKRVYKFPLGMYRYSPPASEVPLVFKWMAKTAYPQHFTDMNLEQEIKDFYKRFYDITLSDEDVHSILNPASEAGDV